VPKEKKKRNKRNFDLGLRNAGQNKKRKVKRRKENEDKKKSGARLSLVTKGSGDGPKLAKTGDMPQLLGGGPLKKFFGGGGELFKKKKWETVNDDQVPFGKLQTGVNSAKFKGGCKCSKENLSCGESKKI